MEAGTISKNGRILKNLMRRKKYLIAIISLVLLAVISSCNNDKDSDNNVNAKLIGKWERQNPGVSGVYGIIITKNTYEYADEDFEGTACSAKTIRSQFYVYCGSSESQYLWGVQDDTLFLGLGRVYKKVDKFSWE
jgi:hypothetical protein